MLSDASLLEDNYYSGPVCASWYTLSTTQVLEWKECKHKSCWAIMCLGDSYVDRWFVAIPTDSPLGMLNAEINDLASKRGRINEFIGQLTHFAMCNTAAEITKLIPGAIDAFNELAKHCDIAYEKMKELARELEDNPPDH